MQKIQTTQTTILFFNSTSLYGMGVNKYLFWAESKHHDTVNINDRSFNALLDKHFALLKDTSLRKGSDIRYGVAFIRKQNEFLIDTLYGSPDLLYWRVDSKNYVDTTLFFSNTFKSFLIYEP